MSQLSRLGLQILANAVFLIHCIVIFIAVFGWLFPGIWLWYMALLVIILVLDIALGYCILSKWEFSLRKKLNPHLNYDYSFSSFYTHRLTDHRLSEHFVSRVGTIFIVASLLINLIIHYAI